jgi:hypothetical protein
MAVTTVCECLYSKKCKLKSLSQNFMLHKTSLLITITQIFVLNLCISAMASNLNIEGLTIGEEGMTLKMDAGASNVQILEHCLIGRFMTDKQIKAKYLQSRLGTMWTPGKGLAVIPVEDNKFLFQFAHPLDVENVLKKGPWLYDNANIVVQKISPGEVPKQVIVNKLDMCVQIHGLPVVFMQEKVGMGFGAYLGEFKEYDAKNTVHSRFMKLKLCIDDKGKKSYRDKKCVGYCQV